MICVGDGDNISLINTAATYRGFPEPRVNNLESSKIVAAPALFLKKYFRVGEIYAKDRVRKTTYKKKTKLGQREPNRRFCIYLMIFS